MRWDGYGIIWDDNVHDRVISFLRHSFFWPCPSFSRCLKDGLETPLQRVPCAVALVLARVSETLASSPFSDLYKVFNRYDGGVMRALGAR